VKKFTLFGIFVSVFLNLAWEHHVFHTFMD
jgi:hypothetical protein